MEILRKHKFGSLSSGKAANIEDFFEQLIKPQFENKEQIKKIHKALLKYIELPDTPLFLRLYGSFSKDNYDLLRRGFLTQFPDSSKMVFCDNTFSMLFSGLKISGHAVDENELNKYLNQNKVICSFGQTSKEKELSYYYSKGAIRVNLNTKGYYLAHMKPVGYGYTDLCARNLREHFPNPDRKEWDSNSKIRLAKNNLSPDQKKLLKAHFIRFVHPLNSFLVPKKNHLTYNGINIGEELEAIKYVKAYLEKEFPLEYKEFEALSLGHEFEATNLTIENIEWFDTPLPKSKAETKKKASKKPKSEITIKKATQEPEKEVLESVDFLTVENIEDELENKLFRWLKSIGMKTFTEIICPSILDNPKVTIEEIAEKYHDFKEYSIGSQMSRLSSSKSILKYGLLNEALQFVIDSKNTKENTRKKAEDLLRNIE